MKEEMPESDFCYEAHVFAESKKCPELDDSIVKEPKCRKYGKGLTWNVSGRILKCKECLNALKKGGD